MPRRFAIADVFTDQPFAGNQLAVVLDAGGLDGAAMQAIAREFNFSETTFVLPPERGGDVRVRIFTPGKEVPFAGHPTIGTALVLAEQGRVEHPADEPVLVLEEAAGLVPVRLRWDGGRFVFAELEAPEAPSFVPAPPAHQLAPVIGLDPGDLVTTHGLPEGASTGLPFLIVELRDRVVLGRARFDGGAFERILGDTPHDHLYLVARDGGPGIDFQVRMFAPGAGVAEDPATGSAAAAFGGWLSERGGLGDGEHRFVLAQGLEMGRPSRLEVTVVRSEGALAAIRVGGGAVIVMEGTLLRD